MQLFKCPVCGHIQIPYLVSNDYYSSYDEVSGFQQYVFGLNKIEDKISKLKSFTNEKGMLIEIGSGGGYALKISNRYFEDTMGFDISEKECEIAKKQGLNVICGEFDCKK